MSNTICAVATPAGEGGISIIRLSGTESLRILMAIYCPNKQQNLMPRMMTLGCILNQGQVVDQVLAVYFPAPHSYTGEDVVEIHGHGGLVSTNMILSLVIQNGAKPAEPGEFTKRAFLNGKLDLSQAEAVQDYIGALSVQSARTAALQMGGALYRRICKVQDLLTDIMASMEAGIEYPEEDLEQDIARDALPKLGGLITDLLRLAGTFQQGKLLREGVRVALVGRPNVGKSSLLNAIIGEEKAIVTEIPGTTRDVVGEYYQLKSVPVLFLDTAGIRDSEDVVEKIGIERSRQTLEQASVAVVLLDASDSVCTEDRQVIEWVQSRQIPLIIALNKTDLPAKTMAADIEKEYHSRLIELSAATGEGIDQLLEEIYASVISDEKLMEGIVITNQRHAHALNEAVSSLREAERALEQGVDLDCVAIDLQAAWRSLGEITGQTVSEEIVDRIFSKFCLGK